jgi:alpha-1,6-mannosyltransferase
VLKTLHLTNSWHEASGGIATFYRALIEAANKRAHAIRLVVPGERDCVEELGEFARIYHVKAPRSPFNSQYRTIYPTQFLFAGSKLQEILAAERPDLVEICDKYTINYLGAVLRKRLLRTLDFRPVIIGLSCERMDDNFRTYLRSVPLSKAFCAAYMKWVYFPFFDHHIANSSYTAEELRAASQGHLVPRNIWIRPMGVNLRHLSPTRRSPTTRREMQRIFQANDDSVFLLYAGRLAPEKNLPLLFELMIWLTRSAKRDYRLLVAGDGIERHRWELYCQKHLPGRASFLGHVKGPDALANLLANADVFIHPNPREPFGIAPLEAMASGLPLIAPNRGGVTSYANSQNAWIAPPDVESFASTVEAVLANEPERIRRAQNALRTAQEYRWEKAAASFLDLYAELHAAAVSQNGLLPAPAFSSTPAEGLALACSRGASQVAEKIFELASGFSPRPRF